MNAVEERVHKIKNMDAIDKFKEKCNYWDRACDALVLAYNPENVLARSSGRNFYIPSGNRVEEAFGEALRKIFGVKQGSSHWADAVKWATVADLKKLESRILEGTQEAICGDSDYQTIFDGYLSASGGRFNHTWICMRGDFYRFEDRKREEARDKFDSFWTPEEKSRWQKIHRFMGEHTQEQYRRKENR
jgi:hypothetical protein